MDRQENKRRRVLQIWEWRRGLWDWEWRRRMPVAYVVCQTAMMCLRMDLVVLLGVQSPKCGVLNRKFGKV